MPSSLPQAKVWMPARTSALPPAPLEVRLACLERRRVVLEGLVEIVDGRSWPALERTADPAPELEPRAQRTHRRGLDVERADRLRTLPRPAAGVHHGEAVEPAAHVEPRGKRRRVRRRAERQHEQCDSVERPERPLYTRRPMTQRSPDKDVDRLIVAAHKRFVKAMDGRLDGMSPEIKETYFSILSKLVTKLETGRRGFARWRRR